MYECMKHKIQNKVASRYLSLCMFRSLKSKTDIYAVFLKDRVIQEEGLYVYNMLNLVEKDLVSALLPCEARAGR
jgi:hypothetical protein